MTERAGSDICGRSGLSAVCDDDMPKKHPSSAGKSTKTPVKQEKPAVKKPRRRGIMAAICFILALFSFIGYFNTEGAFIGFFLRFVKSLVGHGYYALPPALLLCSAILTFHRGRPVRFRTVSALLLTVTTGALMHLFTCECVYNISFPMIAELWKDGKELLAGGAISGSLTEIFTWLFGRIGTSVVFICAALFFLLSAFNKTISGIIDAIRNRERREYIPEPEPVPDERPRRPEPGRAHNPIKKRRAIDIPIDDEVQPPVPEQPRDQPKDSFFISTPQVKTPDQLISENTPAENKPSPDDPEDIEDIEDMPLDIPFMEGNKGSRNDKAALVYKPRPEPPAVAGAGKQPEAAPEQLKTVPDTTKTGSEPAYVFPPVELLAAGTPKTRAGDDEVRVNSDRLESAFRSFGVNVTISNATRGPAVTRYEAELEAGIKLSKLTGLADDIALSLGTSGVRIAAMPNKISTVGIEVPNKNISKVNLRDILESQAFSNAKSRLTFAIGMDISGEAIVGNVSKLPHMLVAGTTGSGKSVCLNSIILSILYKATPEDVRFIMIDPKMVEFKVYNAIPHLLVPVVTDIKKAAGALQWAVF